MRLFSSSNEVQAQYAPIFDGRLLLGMSLFSKKYSIYDSSICGLEDIHVLLENRIKNSVHV